MAADESGLLPIERELEDSQELAGRLLDNLAQKLHLQRAAHHAAAGVQRAARYVQAHSMRDMASAVERVVRQRPAISSLVAAAAGLLVGCALRPKSTLR